MLRQKYMNKYKDKTLFDEERFLKEDEEYLLNESRPVKEASIKNLDPKKMKQFIEDILVDKKLTSLLYSTVAKTEINSYLKSKQYLEKYHKPKNNKTMRKSYTNSVLQKRTRSEAYTQIKSEIENFKNNKENYQLMLKNNNLKKYLELKKDLDMEKNQKNREIINHRILGFKRAYNTIKEKLEQKKERESILSDLQNNLDCGALITLPEIKLNMVNVYSRLYNNAVFSTPLNLRMSCLNKNNKKSYSKRSLTHNKTKIDHKLNKNQKINFSIKNAIPTNNGKEFTINITDRSINKCLAKYTGGPQNLQNLKCDSKENDEKDFEKFVDFYNLEEKKTGNSYLHLATIGNYPEIVQYFLEKGANVNKQNNYGDTALHIALKKRNMNIVKIIMNYKPALNIPNKDGIIAFELFSPQMKVDFHIDKIFIENPAKK
jgi:hypothetical protein